MSKNPLAIVILAAGMGARMKSAKPKVMHELAGKPMIKWLLDTCEDLSPEKIIVVTGPDMPDLDDTVKPHTSVVQQTRNGTGGAVKIAAPMLEGFKGDVLILLGDTPLVKAATLKALIDAKGQNALSILGCVLDNPFGYGRLVINDAGELEDIVEEKDASDQQKQIQLINTGVFCADGAQLGTWLEQLDDDNAQNEFYITQLPSIIKSEGGKTAVAVIEDASEIKGCNTRTDLAALEKTLQDRLRKKHMDAGVSMQDPDTVYLWHDTKIAAGCRLEPDIYFGPNVTVDEGVTIKAFSHIEGTHIKKSAIIGPFARLRPDTEIGEAAKVGNFCEVKKSTIGNGAKINHLAYVGDTIMGQGVNFSAGAITVNYDGFDKHQTVIGKDVMVGSNANLIAPVEIEDGAFIAAGSTITKNVPADALSIARNEAEIREGWAAKNRENRKTKK